MKEKEFIECKICGKVFGIKGIGKHVWNKHSVKAKDYYDSYLKGETEEVCSCGNATTFISIVDGYRKYCSPGCAGRQTIEIRENTCLIKYGHANPFQSEEIIEKIHKTKEIKYGDKGYHNTEQMCATKLKRYGCKGYNNPDKYKETMKNTYGKDITNYYQTDEFKDKSKKTKLENYGDESYSNREKFKETIKNKSPEEKQKSIDKFIATMSSKSEEEKYQISLKISKSVSNYYATRTSEQAINHTNAMIASLKNFHKKLREDKDAYNDFWGKQKEKAYKTKSKNKSWNSSSWEKIVNDKLVSIFGLNNVVHHYATDTRYPFESDFFVKSLDLFIECNFHWTHGGHWFDTNDDNDIQTINKWKEKDTDYYNTAISVWTDKDILKRDVAINNKLNFLAFFNLSEFFEWIKAYEN